MKNYIELVKMKFTAHHTCGILKGLSTTDTMKFGSESDAYDWAIRVNENQRKGNCKFWVDELEKVGVELLPRSF